MTGPTWWTKPVRQLEKPGHFSRMPQPVVLQPGPLKEEPISYGLRTVQWEGPLQFLPALM